MTANIPGIVRKQLRHLAPDREIEVVNFGASAINSNVIADLAPEMVAYAPDVVLVYMGHNEFYGPDGVGAIWLEKTIPFLTGWKYALRGLRLVETAAGLAPNLPDAGRGREEPHARGVAGEPRRNRVPRRAAHF